MSFQIEKGIPLPLAARNRTTGVTHLLKIMAIGDSVLLKGKTHNYLSGPIRRVRLDTGRRFACRMEESGLRVWRTA